MVAVWFSALRVGFGLGTGRVLEELKMYGQTFPLPRGLNDVFGRVRGGTKKFRPGLPRNGKDFVTRVLLNKDCLSLVPYVMS